MKIVKRIEDGMLFGAVDIKEWEYHFREKIEGRTDVWPMPKGSMIFKNPTQYGYVVYREGGLWI
jgi:hypothetical protein